MPYGSGSTPKGGGGRRETPACSEYNTNHSLGATHAHVQVGIYSNWSGERTFIHYEAYCPVPITFLSSFTRDHGHRIFFPLGLLSWVMFEEERR